MAELPEWFHDKYSEKGESFFETARLLYSNHGHQYTQQELAEKVDVSQARISIFTQELDEDEWIDRNTGQTTFVWNTEKYNPAETIATDAVFGLYRDFWDVLAKYTKTVTGVFALVGFILFLTSIVVFVLGLSVASGLVEDSAVPPSFYLGLGTGLVIFGMIMTAFVPFQTAANRSVDRVFGPPGDED